MKQGDYTMGLELKDGIVIFPPQINSRIQTEFVAEDMLALFKRGVILEEGDIKSIIIISLFSSDKVNKSDKELSELFGGAPIKRLVWNKEG